jgi:Xaa-Pro aminopeptidase
VHGEQARRLAALRAAMTEHGLAAYLVPRADEHQNEYVAPSEELNPDRYRSRRRLLS